MRTNTKSSSNLFLKNSLLVFCLLGFFAESIFSQYQSLYSDLVSEENQASLDGQWKYLNPSLTSSPQLRQFGTVSVSRLKFGGSAVRRFQDAYEYRKLSVFAPQPGKNTKNDLGPISRPYRYGASYRTPVKKSSNFPTSAKFLESLDEGEGKNVYVEPAVGLWYAKWSSFNYVGEKNIKPALILNPSLTLTIRDFSFTISSVFNISSGLMTGFSFAGNVSGQELSRVGIEGIKYKNEIPLFRTETWYGHFDGNGIWSYIEDTIIFETKVDSFGIKGKAFNFEILPGKGFETGLWSYFGLRFIHYNTPALMRSEDVPDPRDSNNVIVKVNIPDTRINHVFFIVDAGKLISRGFGFYSSNAEDTRKTTLKIDGHFYYLLFGLGWGSNEPLGGFTTVSSMSLTSVADGNPVFSWDIDLGPKLNVNLSKKRSFSIMLGYKWMDWEIMSFQKKGMAVFSKERFKGLYTKVSFKL